MAAVAVAGEVVAGWIIFDVNANGSRETHICMAAVRSSCQKKNRRRRNQSATIKQSKQNKQTESLHTYSLK